MSVNQEVKKYGTKNLSGMQKILISDNNLMKF